MQSKEIKVEKRDVVGSGAMRRMRADGRIPGVVYAGGESSTMISLDTHEFTMAGRSSGSTQLFRFVSEESDINGKIAFVKEIQKEPMKNKLLHVDFLEVAEGQKIVIPVPVKLLGEPTAVKQGLAVLEQRAYSIDVECVPGKIPAGIEVEVGELTEGSAIHAGDLKLPDGVELQTTPDQTIAAVAAVRGALTATTTDAEADAAADDAAPAEGGEETKPAE